jgi:hypothetical protein
VILAIVIAVLIVLGNLFYFALCRAAHDADEAIAAGTEMFDR